MKKRKPYIMFAIMNYDRVMSVHHRRSEALEAGHEMVIGGKPKWQREVRLGNLRIAKVHVTEA
jgi:hypothetical protein